MKMYSTAFSSLKSSIFTNDILMFIMFLFTLLLFVLTLVFRQSVKKNAKKIELDSNESFSKYLWYELNIAYTVFTTLITIFPLLGMFGTVCGLLGLDLASGDMTNIKNNFFISLTSTAWGIVFSVLFKLLNAFIASGVEENLETAKRLSGLTKK